MEEEEGSGAKKKGLKPLDFNSLALTRKKERHEQGHEQEDGENFTSQCFVCLSLVNEFNMNATEAFRGVSQ
jgi:hypothetical protein